MAPAGAAGTNSKKQKKTKSQKKRQQKLKKVTQPTAVREVKKVEKKVKRLEKKTNGPKIDDRMRTTVTLGIIQGQEGAGLNRQMRIPFNPLLMKASDGANTTPLSIRGSMYEMWKVLHAEVHATPLSGSANVVGSVGFMSLTLNGLEAGADSIDSIKARKHVQMALGRSAVLRLSARELEGPREGWWLVDTSADPAESYGPAVDLLLAYPTHNLLQTTGNNAYTGTLWQIEMRVTYGFSTYHPKPGLQSLVSETLSKPAQVSVKSDADGSLIMTTTDAELLRLFSARERRAANAQTGGKSQTIWAVAGAAVDAAAGVMGPWGWLLKGGFWLVRKIFGAAGANGEVKFQIYPSITAASEDQPIYGAGGTASTTIPVVHVSEVINPNSESNVANDLIATAGGSTEYSGPYRPNYQEYPTYGTPNNPGYSRTMAGCFLFGNWTWQYENARTPYNIGADSSNFIQYAWLAAAQLNGDVVFFQGSETPTQEIGPGGALGTAQTWLKSWSRVWDQYQNWVSSSGSSWKVTYDQLVPSRLPAHLAALFALKGEIIVVKGYVWAVPYSTTNRLNDRCWIYISQQGGGGIVLGSETTSFPQNALRMPITITLWYPGSWQASAIGTCHERPQHLNEEAADDDDEDDDGISLADSFVFHRPDELTGSNRDLDAERELLLERLREIDFRRCGPALGGQ
nr:MAG: capsid protein precursor [Astroviridae sp.]